MATFDEEQISDLAGVLGTNSDALGYHLDAFEAVITDADKANVIETLATVLAIPATTSVTSIEPNLRNFGARIGVGALEWKYCKKIADWLQWPVASNSGFGRLERC